MAICKYDSTEESVSSVTCIVLMRSPGSSEYIHEPVPTVPRMGWMLNVFWFYIRGGWHRRPSWGFRLVMLIVLTEMDGVVMRRDKLRDPVGLCRERINRNRNLAREKQVVCRAYSPIVRFVNIVDQAVAHLSPILDPMISKKPSISKCSTPLIFFPVLLSLIKEPTGCIIYRTPCPDLALNSP